MQITAMLRRAIRLNGAQRNGFPGNAGRV